MQTAAVSKKSAARISEAAVLAIQTANTNEAIIYEQLALRRLAELGVPPEHPPSPPGNVSAPAATSAGGQGALIRTATQGLVSVLRRMVLLVEPVELVRQVAPGKPPQRRDEWEKPQYETRLGL